MSATLLNEKYRTSARLLPLESLREMEGAQGQSSARRGLPSKGETRTLHHQPALALTLTMPCLYSAVFTSSRQVAYYQTISKENEVD
jgi:hypothetical protein